MSNKMDWVDNVEKQKDEENKKGFFNVVEGDNRIQILTHCAPLAQKWNSSTNKYEVAQEGDTNVSIKGVCYVLQDGIIKQASLAYTVVKQLRALQNDPDWAFDEFPMPRMINIRAKGAGTKEVEYSVIPSPKETAVSPEILEELKKKLTPEEIIERKKGKKAEKIQIDVDKDTIEYPENDLEEAKF